MIIIFNALCGICDLVYFPFFCSIKIAKYTHQKRKKSDVSSNVHARANSNITKNDLDCSRSAADRVAHKFEIFEHEIDQWNEMKKKIEKERDRVDSVFDIWYGAINENAKQINRLVFAMPFAMYWCIWIKHTCSTTTIQWIPVMHILMFCAGLFFFFFFFCYNQIK